MLADMTDPEAISFEVPGRPKRRPEDALQRAIIKYLRLALPRALVFHIPNGGARSKTEAAILKGLGVLPGIPDVAIIPAGGIARFIEVKAPKGRVSEAQSTLHAQMASLGIPYAVVRSMDDVEGALTAWGLK